VNTNLFDFWSISITKINLFDFANFHCKREFFCLGRFHCKREVILLFVGFHCKRDFSLGSVDFHCKDEFFRFWVDFDSKRDLAIANLLGFGQFSLHSRFYPGFGKILSQNSALVNFRARNLFWFWSIFMANANLLCLSVNFHHNCEFIWCQSIFIAFIRRLRNFYRNCELFGVCVFFIPNTN
jgi:hypothetical protein